MSVDGKPAHCCTRILPNYNKTRINIGHQHNRLMELKEVLRVQTHADV